MAMQTETVAPKGFTLWRNARWGRMESYLKHDEVSFNFPKLWMLLTLYGSAFDDFFYYRLTESYVIRRPVWDSVNRSGSYYEDKDRRKT